MSRTTSERASPEAIADLLSRVPTFTGLSHDELIRIAQVTVPRSFPAGSLVLREGDPGDTCYVMRCGRARITREHTGRAITLTNIGPGEIFGELAMFGGEVRSATVEAIEDVEAVAILADDLKRLLSEHPEIAVKLLGALGAEAARGERADRQAVVPEGLEPGRRRAGAPDRDRQRHERGRGSEAAAATEIVVTLDPGRPGPAGGRLARGDEPLPGRRSSGRAW